MWSNMIVSGPKEVTSAMLAAHPSHGTQAMNPTASRSDTVTWTPTGLHTPYYPDGPPLQRPRVPPTSLFQNDWMNGFDMESRDTAREMRSVVKEDNRFREQDSSTRIMGRTFEHQWVPSAIVDAQLVAAERLRPAPDDYRQNYR